MHILYYLIYFALQIKKLKLAEAPLQITAYREPCKRQIIQNIAIAIHKFSKNGYCYGVTAKFLIVHTELCARNLSSCRDFIKIIFFYFTEFYSISLSFILFLLEELTHFQMCWIIRNLANNMPNL